MAIKFVWRSMLVVLIASAGCSRAPRLDDGTKPFQGGWGAIGADGKKLDITAVFNRDTLRLVESIGEGTQNVSTSAEKFAIRINRAPTPAEIDFVCLDGDNQGKTKLGIFAFEKSQLKICVGDYDAARPAEFAANEKSRLLVFERETLPP